MNFCHILRYGVFVTMLATVTSLGLCTWYGHPARTQNKQVFWRIT